MKRMDEVERRLLACEIAEEVARHQERPMLAEAVAEMLGLSERTVQQKTRDGELPSHKCAGKTVYYLSELNQIARRN